MRPTSQATGAARHGRREHGDEKILCLSRWQRRRARPRTMPLCANGSALLPCTAATLFAPRVWAPIHARSSLQGVLGGASPAGVASGLRRAAPTRGGVAHLCLPRWRPGGRAQSQHRHPADGAQARGPSHLAGLAQRRRHGRRTAASPPPPPPSHASLRHGSSHALHGSARASRAWPRNLRPATASPRRRDASPVPPSDALPPHRVAPQAAGHASSPHVHVVELHCRGGAPCQGTLARCGSIERQVPCSKLLRLARRKRLSRRSINGTGPPQRRPMRVRWTPRTRAGGSRAKREGCVRRWHDGRARAPAVASGQASESEHEGPTRPRDRRNLSAEASRRAGRTARRGLRAGSQEAQA